ncbi:hypothetical protein M622_12015 [Thauera terpenica 58Eu]|uniref:Uncharacterized protein n=1 Tax=Thauera terpenica 58Eu TaxID=1348657 RepID=S9ZH30_9RHOO|nr:hypothetical protein M622_12015 [Thauera terpenica 58Eu]
MREDREAELMYGPTLSIHIADGSLFSALGS